MSLETFFSFQTHILFQRSESFSVQDSLDIDPTFSHSLSLLRTMTTSFGFSWQPSSVKDKSLPSHVTFIMYLRMKGAEDEIQWGKGWSKRWGGLWEKPVNNKRNEMSDFVRKREKEIELHQHVKYSICNLLLLLLPFCNIQALVVKVIKSHLIIMDWIMIVFQN